MKIIQKSIKILALAMLAGAGFTACDNEDYLTITAVEPSDAVQFTNTLAENYVLSEQFADNVAERFVWNNPNFGAQTPVNFTLEGSSSAAFEVIDYSSGSISTNNQAITVGTLLEIAEQMGLDSDPETTHEDGTPNNSGELFFRVKAFVGDAEAANSVSSESEISSMKFELLETGGPVEEILRDLFFVGNTTAADWNNNNNNQPLFRDPADANIYYFTGSFLGDGNEFKLLEVKGQWQPQWGTNDGTTLAVNPGGEGGSDPGAFSVPTSGYYSFSANLEEGTFTVEAFDAASSPEFTSLSIIGEATPLGWDGDTEMTQSTFDPHQWYILGQELGDGEMKIRETGNWGVNWGGNTAISGQGTQDGPNIPVTAGVYDIWFNDLDGRYIFIPVAE